MAQTNAVATAAASEMETQEEDYDIPAELETIIGEPQEGLPDKRTFIVFLFACLFFFFFWVNTKK